MKLGENEKALTTVDHALTVDPDLLWVRR